MATQSSDVKLKLLIDTKKQRVLFGEADKMFIDFIFNLLSLPLGTVVTLLKNQTVLGSLENVYESVQTLSDTYMKPGQNKDILLKPKASIYCSTTTKLLPDIVIDSSTTAKSFYLCNTKKYATCGHSVSDGVDAICPSCSNYMDQVGTYVQPPSDWNATTQQTSNSGEDNGLGFVKDVVTYMVM
ncbi:uncharacterized protein LOC101208014 [Cucumis sativus]|uniref:uncharacterized protein LOC101208014 n=1 Tax=Cucumis sativus TaxID=3659 RepID=UPI0002B4387D|nr:uncharacterized protein LOC101208014 [Cucumis sativus]KAE8647973.1 hypothetical protein Csa_000608 [Cucumis sativus]